MFAQLYFLIQYVVVTLLLVVIAAMALRLIFNYTDPNPFGSVGKFSYWLKKKTDSFVRPMANWLAIARLDARLAPLLAILVACVAGYFTLQIFGAVTFTLDGVIESLQTGRFVMLIGFLLYGFLALLSLAIIIRIILSWVLSYDNPVLRFLARMTNWIMEPFRRLIPSIGMIDISPIILLFLLDLFQRAVAGTLIASGR